MSDNNLILVNLTFTEFLAEKLFNDIYKVIIIEILSKHDIVKISHERLFKLIEECYNKYYTSYPESNSSNYYYKAFWNYFWKQNFNSFYRNDGIKLIELLLEKIANDNQVVLKNEIELNYLNDKPVKNEYYVFFKKYNK